MSAAAALLFMVMSAAAAVCLSVMSAAALRFLMLVCVFAAAMLFSMTILMTAAAMRMRFFHFDTPPKTVSIQFIISWINEMISQEKRPVKRPLLFI
ncbi:MAG: hypothetical protein IJD60_08045 [Clostridia bacterium]|nr:hypothetical protein [Clostridia bacterium]